MPLLGEMFCFFVAILLFLLKAPGNSHVLKGESYPKALLSHDTFAQDDPFPPSVPSGSSSHLRYPKFIPSHQSIPSDTEVNVNVTTLQAI